jgi:hypothetical protein
LRKKNTIILSRLSCFKIKRAGNLSPQMMIDNRPVIINGRVALRLFCAGFSVRIKKVFTTITPKAFEFE